MGIVGFVEIRPPLSPFSPNHTHRRLGAYGEMTEVADALLSQRFWKIAKIVCPAIRSTWLAMYHLVKRARPDP